jgi:hypothetical protein
MATARCTAQLCVPARLSRRSTPGVMGSRTLVKCVAELGVAGVAYALGSVGCLTAASCRWHSRDRSWSDCPVVFFVAPKWRLELVAELIDDAGCGLVADRGMLAIHAQSIVEMHTLGERVVAERERFRRKPDHGRAPSDRRRRLDDQLLLPLDPG